MTDLESRILRVVTSTRAQADIPAKVLAEIAGSHVVIDKERWERVREYADADISVSELYTAADVDFTSTQRAANRRRSARIAIQPGDLDTIPPEGTTEGTMIPAEVR